MKVFKISFSAHLWTKFLSENSAKQDAVLCISSKFYCLKKVNLNCIRVQAGLRNVISTVLESMLFLMKFLTFLYFDCIGNNSVCIIDFKMKNVFSSLNLWCNSMKFDLGFISEMLHLGLVSKEKKGIVSFVFSVPLVEDTWFPPSLVMALSIL